MGEEVLEEGGASPGREGQRAVGGRVAEEAGAGGVSTGLALFFDR